MLKQRIKVLIFYLLIKIIYLLNVNKMDVSAIDVATIIPQAVTDILKNTNTSEVKNILNDTRRIINGVDVTTDRPYMVYLKLPQSNPKYKEYRRWLCGGVIIHEEYILTSAACIEDAKNFYVVSGTYRYGEADDRYNNACIKNGAKKAIWKCVPRNYVFDGHENDNLRWMNNDIAVVKVEDEFDFSRRVRGCDFIPRPICYNNYSTQMEDPGNIGTIAGWGSTDKYNEWVNSRRQESFQHPLRETAVRIISKNRCKKRWGSRYHNIIDNYMICSKDLVPDLSEICQDKYVDCTDIMYSAESGEERRRVLAPSELVLHSAHHNETGRRVMSGSYGSGGFCENDHGGPLVYGEGADAVVIGIISACLVKERTNKCYGPFLYTSVYKNRVLITCAIYKDAAYKCIVVFRRLNVFRKDCNKLFRSSVTHTETEMSWIDHPDGPSKNEVSRLRRNKIESSNGSNQSEEFSSDSTKLKNVTLQAFDKVLQHGGVILRAFNVQSTNKTIENNTDINT